MNLSSCAVLLLLVVCVVHRSLGQQCDVDPADRVDCGWPGIGQDTCEAKGCCFNSAISGVIWCFYGEGQSLVNVALGKTTTQSSQGWSGSPHRAVDGNTDPNYGGQSCTHTLNHPNSWWAVDLQSEVSIDRVVIYNRQDCCGERLRQLQIYVAGSMPTPGDNPDPNAADSAPCGDFDGPSSNGAVVTVQCQPLSGRYLVIQNKNIAEYLTLCEVEVLSSENNIAQGKPTLQVNTGWSGDSSRATDGNTNPDYGGQSCTHTLAVPDPWLVIDLEQGYRISSVVLFNRDLCCGERLHDVLVYGVAEMPSVGNPPSLNDPNSQFCAIYDGPAVNGEVVELSCLYSTVIRYLVIQIAGTEYLTLCEVQVYGQPAELPAITATSGGGAADCSAVEAELSAKTAEVSGLQGEKAQCQADLAASQAQVATLNAQIEALSVEPVMPTASPTATLSATGYRFTLEHNAIEYILETTAMHIATKSDDFCEQFGMKLAQVENQETLDALSLQLSSIQSDNGITLTEVATGERSSVNLDRDIEIEAFNAAGWNCATMVPDGDSFKMVGKKCNGERAVLCAAVPLYC